MSLSPGARLGPYEIVSALGAGGMGEVYKAKDTRLDRTVAVKVLAASTAADPEFRARFEREARTISQLNHPHICVLHDVGRDDGRDFLVMEYLEGQTLAARLEKGPLALDQALKCAIEIADALDRAHRQGVVHRDLKPGNVMLTKAGAKLLDFGLAKPGGAPAAGVETQLAAPGQPPLTARGTILGTFQYMAPEQLEGKEADVRSDVWAFGCVLHEMLTGKSAFQGQSQASLIGAILNQQPPAISTLQPLSPPTLDRIVRTCLAKDPEDRWQNVHDLANELKWIGESAASATGVVAHRATPRQIMWRVAVIAASIVAGATLASLWWRARSPSSSALIQVRAVVTLPPGSELTVGSRQPLALSPDGRVLAYAASAADGSSEIFIRPLDRFESTPVGGTKGGTGPFFSPDGQWLGFFVVAEGRLKKVALSGGAPVVICEAPDVRGASWGRDDSIVYTGQLDGGLLRIASGSRTPEELTKPSLDRHEKTHRFPDVLPNGKGVIFTIGTHDITSFSDARIAVYEFATRQTKVLIEGGSDARYLPPGYLVYGRSGALMAVRFDAERLTVEGTPVPMVDALLTSSVYGPANFAATATGALAYIQGAEPLDIDQLLLMDRAGRPTPVGDRRFILAAQLSPTGDRALVRIGGANDTLWVQDLRRSGAFSRLTFRGNVSGAVWTPDGRRIIYNIGNEIASIAADGSGDDRTIFRDQFTGIPASITSDGKTVLYSTNRPGTGWDIWALSVEDGKARAVLSAPFTERAPRLSPDGRWIAYTSNESGREEVYVRPYPTLGSRSLISSDGGSLAVWSRDGREIFFRRGSEVYVVKVLAAGAEFDSSAPSRVPMPQPLAVASDAMDLAPDGRLLLIQATPRPSPKSLSLVTGWLDELTRRVPIGK
jgi:serine/threonine-protein kinase